MCFPAIAPTFSLFELFLPFLLIFACLLPYKFKETKSLKNIGPMRAGYKTTVESCILLIVYLFLSRGAECTLFCFIWALLGIVSNLETRIPDFCLMGAKYF